MKAVPKPGTIAFAREYFAHRDPAVLAVLRQSSVGIAGAGGLGSNVAVALARAGVGRLVIADFDRIEPSNLNRQQYFVDQVGERQGRGPAREPAGHQSLLPLRGPRRPGQSAERGEDLRPGGRPRRGLRPGRGQGDAHRSQPVEVPGPAHRRGLGPGRLRPERQDPHPADGQSLHLRRRGEPEPERRQPDGAPGGPGRGHAGQPASWSSWSK